MHYSKLTTIIGSFLLLGMRAFTQQPVDLHYTLSLEDPGSHKMHVVFQCKGLSGPVVDFKMPAWMPGYYQILDYAKKVENFHASDGKGKDLAWEKSLPNTWRVENPAGAGRVAGRAAGAGGAVGAGVAGGVGGGAGGGVVTISYDVKATTPFVAQPWLDSTRGYVSPAGVFMYVNGYLRQPVTVEVKYWKGWNKLATGLEKVAGKENWYRAPDFDILYDCPMLAANLEEVPSFKVRNIPHYFYGYKIGEFDRAAFSADLKKIVEQGVNMIGDIPYPHYTFLATGSGRGGIEHLNSTTIGFSGDQLKTPDSKQRVMCFIAHEYFHHYNIKRIRPIALGPFDYERENRTNMLWVSEGLSVYYEYMLVRRAGLMTSEDLLHHFQSDINAYESKTGHLYQSLAQSSWETWSDGPFGRTGDSINRTISYYQKGPAVGLLLDMAIRHSTRNKKSLDDVMRTVYRVYYQQKKRGFTDAEFRKVCEDVAGMELPEIFDYVYTVKEPDYAKYLGYGGLGIDAAQGFKLYPLKEVDELQAAIRKDWIKE